MTNSEVRATAVAYYQIRELLNHPLPEKTRDTFNTFLQTVAEDCFTVSDTSAPSRWARGVVGPVLAAALGAAVYMRDDVPSPHAALRIFGLAGDRPLSSQSAWRLIQGYRDAPCLTDEMITEIGQKIGIRLRLPPDPTIVDVLDDITRPRSGKFPVQVAHWLSQYFRESARPLEIFPPS